MIVDKIQQAIEEGKYSRGVFLNLCKAFDTVNHTILIKKLEYYGIRGVAKDLFSSYLTIHVCWQHCLRGLTNFLWSSSGIGTWTPSISYLHL